MLYMGCLLKVRQGCEYEGLPRQNRTVLGFPTHIIWKHSLERTKCQLAVSCAVGRTVWLKFCPALTNRVSSGRHSHGTQPAPEAGQILTRWRSQHVVGCLCSFGRWLDLAMIKVCEAKEGSSHSDGQNSTARTHAITRQALMGIARRTAQAVRRCDYMVSI
jgi:hypothetical protein